MPRPHSPLSERFMFGKKVSLVGSPNEGYNILPTASTIIPRSEFFRAKEKIMGRGTIRRTQYFYNIVFLIALSIILYLFSSQLLSQQHGGGGGGEAGRSDSNSVIIGRLSFGSGGSSSSSSSGGSGFSSLSNDFNNDKGNYQKTGQLSGGQGESRDGGNDEENENINVDGVDNNVLDGRAEAAVFGQPQADGESLGVLGYDRGTTTTEHPEEAQTTKDWLTKFSETAHKLYAMFSPDYLKEFRKWAVKQQREMIALEMKGYKFQTGNNIELNDLIMEKGGQPVRNVIFTTWRSGSTFLGETLESHPGTFYHYEPLLHFNIKQVRSGEPAKEGLRVLNQLLNCNYTGLNDFLEFGKTHHWLYSHNTRVWQYCAKSYDVCWDAKFLSDMCKLFPFQSVKTVRMRLRLAKTLLENKKINIRLILLVRDPRGTMQSRNHRDWCPLDPDCYDPSKLCMDMVDDFNYAEKLREKYPDRFLPIRYEDMSLSPYESMQKIFKFFRLQYHPQVEKFLSSHTKINVGGVSSTFRDSKTTPFHWRNDFVGNFSLVNDIQNQCDAAMKLWGYAKAEDENQLLTFNPLKRPPWPEMFVLNSTDARDELYVK